MLQDSAALSYPNLLNFCAKVLNLFRDLLCYFHFFWLPFDEFQTFAGHYKINDC